MSIFDALIITSMLVAGFVFFQWSIDALLGPDLTSILCGLLLLVCSAGLIILGVVVMMYSPEYTQEAKEAIELCEAELPRNLHCEVVISAEVKDV